MNILVINGSPRAKGNSDILCDEFVRGAKESGNNTEKISLRDMNIHTCKACYACLRTGSCVQKDDMSAVLAKAEAANVLVLASPTYFLTMSGQMEDSDRPSSSQMARARQKGCIRYRDRS